MARVKWWALDTSEGLGQGSLPQTAYEADEPLGPFL
jgi:hypothetical protein